MSKTLFPSGSQIPPKEKPARNLLDMATNKTSKQDWSASSVDINHVLSASKKATRQVTLHEQYVPRSENTPYEVNVHRINFMGGIIELPSDSEEEEAAATLPPATPKTPKEITDIKDLRISDAEPYIDLLSPEAFKTAAATAKGEPYVDLLSPEAFRKAQLEHKPGEVQAEVNKQLHESPPQYMQGRFSEVEKPVPMVARIQPTPDGSAFTYEKTPSHSSSSHGDDTQQFLAEDIKTSREAPINVRRRHIH